jgi:hypothetical protein
MKTYSVDLRHAQSKRLINATPNNRFDTLRRRLDDDADAIAWARTELFELAKSHRGKDFQYVESAVMELLPYGDEHNGKDYRRLGRWVCNAEGLIWRPTPEVEEETV